MSGFWNRMFRHEHEISKLVESSGSADDLSLERSRDRLLLRRAFYQSYDRSLAEHFLNHPKLWGAPIGEGSHFSVHHLSISKNIGTKLCVHIASPRFLDERNPQKFNRWLDAFKKLMQQDLELMPPIELVQLPSLFATIMPLCNGELSDRRTAWLDIERIKTSDAQKLRSARLHIDDTWQMMCWEGVPMLYDFSDLISI